MIDCNLTYHGHLVAEFPTYSHVTSGVLNDYPYSQGGETYFNVNGTDYIVQTRNMLTSFVNEADCTFYISYHADPIFTDGFD